MMFVISAIIVVLFGGALVAQGCTEAQFVEVHRDYRFFWPLIGGGILVAIGVAMVCWA